MYCILCLGEVVTVDTQGQGHEATHFSSLQMSWAAAQRDTLYYRLNPEEHCKQNIDEVQRQKAQPIL